MAVSTKAKSVALSKAPVLETIFEIHWELSQVPNTQIRRDPSYPLLYGRLYDRFKKDYSIAEDLPSTQVHPDQSPYVVRHRIRKADGFPLVQVGPGVLTVHEGKGYSWDRYRDEIVRIFEAFTDFYPSSTFPLKIVKAELRFINGVELEAGTNPLEFVTQQLHTKVELDPGLFATNQVNPQAQGLNLTVGFKLEEPVGSAMLAIGTGAMIENKSAIIQQMAFQSILEHAPQDLGALDPWLDDMHAIAQHWFSTLYRGELLKKFA